MFKRRKMGPLISPNCSHYGLRYLLFMAVLTFVASAYWWNFDRHLSNFSTKSAEENAMQSAQSYIINNEHGLFSAEDVAKLTDMRDAFKAEWGIPLFIHVSPEALHVPEFEPYTLYVGAGLKHTEAVIIFPPLLKKALGTLPKAQENINELPDRAEGIRLETEEKLAQCLPQNTVAHCLEAAVSSLRKAMQ